MTKINIYSTPNCQQCRATYRELDKRGHEYTVYDATDPQHEMRVDELCDILGTRQAPLVSVSKAGAAEVAWSGFRPDLIGIVLGDTTTKEKK